MFEIRSKYPTRQPQTRRTAGWCAVLLSLVLMAGFALPAAAQEAEVERPGFWVGWWDSIVEVLGLDAPLHHFDPSGFQSFGAESSPGLDPVGSKQESSPGLDPVGASVESSPGLDPVGVRQESSPGLDPVGAHQESSPGLDPVGHSIEWRSYLPRDGGPESGLAFGRHLPTD